MESMGIVFIRIRLAKGVLALAALPQPASRPVRAESDG
jgi:hypothetical protein